MLLDADGVTNPRTLQADSVSTSITKSVPQADWSLSYNQSVSPSGAASPFPGIAPQYLWNAMFWQVDSIIFSCGGGAPTISDCASWNEELSQWTWFGVASFSPRVSGGASFVDRARNRLWIYGGRTETGYSNLFWYANYDIATNAITSGWQNLTVVGGPSGPGLRAWFAHWQVRQNDLTDSSV